MSKFRFYLILILCAQWGYGKTTVEGIAYEYFLKAEYEILQNNFKKAEIYFIKAHSLSPESPTILRSLVDLKLYQGKYPEAIQYLEKMLVLDPDNKETGLDLYEFYYQTEKVDKAERVLDSLMVYHPDDEELLLIRANTQYTHQDWENLLYTYKSLYLNDDSQVDILLKIYEIGIATGNVELVQEIFRNLKPISDNKVIRELLIEISSSQGEFDNAIDLLRELLENNQESIQYKISLGELYLRNQQFEEVITILTPLFENGNHFLEVLRILLIAYSTLDRIEEEISISGIMIEKYPDLSIGYEALSFAYLESGDEEKAAKFLLQALPKFPEVITFPYTLASIFNQAGSYDEAEYYYERTLDIQSDLVSAKHALAIMYEEMEDTIHCDSLFLQMIKLDETNSVGHNDYAYILSERESSTSEDLNFALELAETAISIEPENAAFLDTIGWIYFKLGIYQKAEEYLKKSLSINNENPVILEHLADIYVKLNNSIEAVNLYEKVLKLDTGNQNIKEKIKKIHDR